MTRAGGGAASGEGGGRDTAFLLAVDVGGRTVTMDRLCSAFTGAVLRPEDERRLQERTTAIDRFSVHGRDVFWLCRVKQSRSIFPNVVLEKLLGRPSTLRSVTTVARIVARYG